MSMKRCRDCNNPISSYATTCPRCGWNRPILDSLVYKFLLVILAGIVLFVFGVLFQMR